MVCLPVHPLAKALSSAHQPDGLGSWKDFLVNKEIPSLRDLAAKAIKMFVFGVAEFTQKVASHFSGFCLSLFCHNLDLIVGRLCDLPFSPLCQIPKV